MTQIILKKNMPETLAISHGKNEFLYAMDNQKYIDLITGFGAVFMGHSNPSIVQHVQQQLNKVWTTGKIPVSLIEEATALTEEFLPESLKLAGFYSTGMEAVEFALRVAASITGKGYFLGFENSMHGKSVATSLLAWTPKHIRVPNFIRLPYLPRWDEADILDVLEKKLASQPVAGVIIETIQATAGGFQASPTFYQQAFELCRQYGAMSIYDEILTGFYRTGTVFNCQNIGIYPDILVMGKSIANGFPCSAVAVSKDIKIINEMLPGSTFSENLLAMSAVKATLEEMKQTEMALKIQRIEQIIQQELTGLDKIGVTLRGRGALWVLELPDRIDTSALADRLLKNRVLVSLCGKYMRLLPPAVIMESNLKQACSIIKMSLRTTSLH